jgi:hypothetical protein
LKEGKRTGRKNLKSASLVFKNQFFTYAILVWFPEWEAELIYVYLVKVPVEQKEKASQCR